MTRDIDIQLHAEPTASTVFGLVVEELAHDQVFDQDILICHPPLSATPFELFIVTHWYTSQALGRRQLLASPALGHNMWMPTPEDFILLKAASMDMPGRQKARLAVDAAETEAAAHTLDIDYVTANAGKLGLQQRLSEILPDR